MATISAARSSLRSAARFAGTTTSKPKMASTSPFRISSQKPVSSRFFRLPVEMSCAVESMLPYHTATASALLNSMLSVAPRGYGWMIEGSYQDGAAPACSCYKISKNLCGLFSGCSNLFINKGTADATDKMGEPK